MDVKARNILGCSDLEMEELRILRAQENANSRTTTLDFRRADFDLFKDLLSRVQWDKALEGRGGQEK